MSVSKSRKTDVDVEGRVRRGVMVEQGTDDGLKWVQSSQILYK